MSGIASGYPQAASSTSSRIFVEINELPEVAITGLPLTRKHDFRREIASPSQVAIQIAEALFTGIADFATECSRASKVLQQRKARERVSSAAFHAIA